MEPASKLNDRQELFCQEYVHRPVGRWAAEKAGYDIQNAASQACRLLRREDIQARIAQLRDVVVQRHCRDADAILARLNTLFELALINHRYNSAINALSLQARIAGLLPGRNTAGTSLQDAAEAGQLPEAAAPAGGSPSMPTNANQRQPEIPPAAEPGDPVVPESRAVPHQEEADGVSDGEAAPEPTNADQSRSVAQLACGETAESPPLPQAPHPDGAAAMIPAEMPIDADQGQPVSPHAIPKAAAIAQWPSARKRHTLSGRRK